ncbi:MAG TPA: prolyl oligopeptidase family serine peptidase [Thermoanaerobaculia bacterium]|jgi:prolyl oligopeptidase|nr:prolyl oligopeptidase family serine peptidase [Thermoanaerobaculia bacterium]
MFQTPRTFGVLAALLLLPTFAEAIPKAIQYPETRKVDQKDTFHGVTVADPYRWLEGDVRETKEVRAWVEAQNRVTSSYLSSLPQREAIRKRLAELWRYEEVETPVHMGGRYFTYRNDGVQNQDVLYVQSSLVEEPEVLIDPNGWSKDGTIALSDLEPSPDGRYAVYGMREAGSDWRTWRVMDLSSRQLLPEELKWIKGCCASWTPDGKGFFYNRLPEPKKGEEYQRLNLGSRVWYHRVGTPQSADALVFEQPEHPAWDAFPEVTEDGRYLLLPLSNDTGKLFRVLYKDLAEPYGMIRTLIPDFENEYFIPVASEGTVIYLFTDHQAARGRLVAVDIDHPEQESWKEIVPQSEHTLAEVSRVGNLFFAQYLRDAKSHVRLFTLAGRHIRDIELPGIGSVRGFEGRRDSSETFYRYTSYDMPPSIYRYDLMSGESTLLHRPKLALDPALFEVRQVFYNSKDGTRIPMFLAHRKGLRLDGSNPALLYGYGGFNVSETPNFSPFRLAWMEMGGVYALPNLRGGGEYGEEWHEAGTKTRRQNVYDDFIAAAEWLIANGYTRPERLAVQGGSNGGLLVGAVMTQRPDLFGAALPAVGVMDMLRFHLFTSGRFWVDDYGSVDKEDEFRALYAYSPYHNLKPGMRYPATLVTTADTDDRVVPGHSFKFAARLQEVQAGEAPVLIRIESRAGHGSGTPTSKLIERYADELAFLVENLGMRKPGEAAKAP